MAMTTGGGLDRMDEVESNLNMNIETAEQIGYNYRRTANHPTHDSHHEEQRTAYHEGERARMSSMSVSREPQIHSNESHYATADDDVAVTLNQELLRTAATTAATSMAIDQQQMERSSSPPKITTMVIHAPPDMNNDMVQTFQSSEQSFEGAFPPRESSEVPSVMQSGSKSGGQSGSNASDADRLTYNTLRRKQYHSRSDHSKKRRRERDKERYNAIAGDEKKQRNDSRAQLERERYKKLTKEELASRNKKRRERANQRKETPQQAQIEEAGGVVVMEGSSVASIVPLLPLPPMTSRNDGREGGKCSTMDI